MGINAGLGQANVAIRATLDKLDGDLGQARSKVSSAVQKIAGSAANSLKMIGTVAIAGTMAAAGAIIGLSAVIAKLASKAASVEGIKNAFDGLASSAGISGDAMLAALQKGSAGMVSQRDLMLSFNKAAQLVSTDFAVKLPDAMQYLGKVAAATGQDMDYMMNSLVVGVGRLSPMILDNLGVQASLAEATGRAAVMFGIEADALSKAQIQAGMMNVVLEKLAINTANMPDVVGTTIASMAQLKAGLQDTSEQIGGFFLPAYGTMVKALVDSVHWFQAATAEGGFLYPVMVNLGAAASLVSDKLSQLGEKAREAGESVFSEFGGRIMATAEAAFGWGIEIVTQLANGIIQGAVAALTVAMNFVSSILSWFLSPGSPPRVAPNIDKWGMEAMNEYLTGFTMASFDILNGLQGPLSSILSSLVTSGDLGKEAAATLFRDISADMTYAVSEFQQTGVIYEGLLKRLSGVGGEFGKQLVELTKRQFAMADANERMAAATDRMREATERLVTAQEDQETAQTDLARITDEYNSLLMNGASYEELYAKRAEKAAATRRAKETKDALAAAKTEKDAAEIGEKAAKEQLAIDRDRLNVQSRLIDQMELWAKTQADMVVAAEKAAGGGGGGGAGVKIPKGGGGGALELPELPEIGGGFGGGLTSSLETAIEEAKQKLKDKWAELIKPFTDMLESPEIQTAMDTLSAAWDGFTSGLKLAYDTWIQPLIDGFNELIPADTRDRILEDLGKIQGVFLVLAAAVLLANAALAIAGGIIAAVISPAGLLTLAIIALVTIWETNFLGIKTFLEGTWWPFLSTLFQSVMDGIDTYIIVPIQNLLRVWTEDVWPVIQTVTENVWTIIKTIFEELGRWVTDNIGPWVQELGRIWSEEVWPAIKLALQDAWTYILGVWELLLEWLDKTLPGGLEGLQGVWKDVMAQLQGYLQPVKDIWDAFVSAVTKFWDWISSKTFTFKISLPNLPPWALPGSPLPIHTAWKNFAEDMNKLTIHPSVDFDSGFMERVARPTDINGTASKAQINIYGLTLEGVQNKAGLLAELQALT